MEASFWMWGRWRVSAPGSERGSISPSWGAGGAGVRGALSS